MSAALELAGVAKTFTMHLQGGVRLPVVSGVGFSVMPGECAVLAGPSGAGKSSILKMIFGNYRCDRGQILVRQASTTRRCRDGGAAPASSRCAGHRSAMSASSCARCRACRRSTSSPSRWWRAARRATRRASRRPSCCAGSTFRSALWALPPATFSGGEQQRVNIARGFLPDLPLLLLDEPTASLDAANRAVVIELIAEKKRRGAAIVAIVHDDNVRDAHRRHRHRHHPLRRRSRVK